MVNSHEVPIKDAFREALGQAAGQMIRKNLVDELMGYYGYNVQFDAYLHCQHHIRVISAQYNFNRSLSQDLFAAFKRSVDGIQRTEGL